MTAHTYEHKYRLAAQFARRFQNEKRERAEKDTFWNEFFAIFGLDRFRTAFLFALYQKAAAEAGKP